MTSFFQSTQNWDFDGILQSKLKKVWASSPKLGEELTSHFKVDMRSLTNFDPSTWKSQKFLFEWIPFEKSIYCLNYKKVRKSYLSWNWRGMQNLERNLLVSKLAQVIWQILTWAFKSIKNFLLIGSFSTKYILFELKKLQKSYLSWNWRGIHNLERNRLVVSKLAYGIWQLLTWALKSLKYFHFNSPLLSKVNIVWVKKVQRSHLSRKWRGMQNLERNQLVVSKLA